MPRQLPEYLVREVPAHSVSVLSPRQHDYCVVIPVINEGDRIRNQLRGMADSAIGADIVIVDGGSTDGSLDEDYLRSCGVHALLVKTGPGKQSAQLRIGLWYALTEGFDGAVMIDGNGKDGYEAIPLFLDKLERGYGYVQGSRYAPGGAAINTPLERSLAVRLLHAPLISLKALYWFTDTTNGFRAVSRDYLLDPALQPFRDIFMTYNLHYYLAVRAIPLGYRVCEVGVTRAYPDNGEIPTKIGGWRGKLHILRLLYETLIGKYDYAPKE